MAESKHQEPVAQLRLYRNWLHQDRNLQFADYAGLWAWSTTCLDAFWRSIWDYFEIDSPTPFAAVLTGGMPGARWFAGAEVNYARQIFRHTSAADAADQPAIIADCEAGIATTTSWAELRQKTASLALELRRHGVRRGDRVAAYLPNTPDAVIAMLACASIGAVWTMCAPDMGLPAVLDRFRQTRPKVLIAATGVHYGGRYIDRRDAVTAMREGLPTVETTFIVAGANDTPMDTAELSFNQAIARHDAETDSFEPEWVPFDHPLWILYSSGTTGLPKAIVHGHGGVILTSLVGNMHLDLGPSYAANTLGERFHWYCSTGWVMWNVQLGGLLSGATICLFDGSPKTSASSPDWRALWDFAARHRVTWFGAGAAFYQSCRRAGLQLEGTGGLRTIRALGTTGSPLDPATQNWGTQMFAAPGRPDIWWCNISGGTDIAAAFFSGNRELPPAPGRLQCRQLGAAVEAWDANGTAVVGTVGELVCTRPLPSMPLYFWGDAGGARYRATYFDAWPDVWRHGDWLTVMPNGNCIISGRSDATINRHGVRMGTADIYAAVEALAEIDDSLVLDLEDGDGDSQLLMFVVPAEGCQLNSETVAHISAAIRQTLSPRFVPDYFLAAPAIPRTLSGKKQELPIKRLFLGWPTAKVINRGTTQNPEVLDWFVETANCWRKSDGRGDDSRQHPGWLRASPGPR